MPPDQTDQDVDTHPPTSAWVAREVQAYLKPTYRSSPDERALDRDRMLFNLSHRPFEELLPAWLDLIERLGPVPSMILGLRYISRSYTENSLITAVAAAEALHRRLLQKEAYTSEEEYEALRQSALQAVPEEHRSGSTSGFGTSHR